MSSLSEIVLGQILDILKDIKKILEGREITVSSTYEPRTISKEDLERIMKARPGDVIEINGEAPTKEKE